MERQMTANSMNKEAAGKIQPKNKREQKLLAIPQNPFKHNSRVKLSDLTNLSDVQFETK